MLRFKLFILLIFFGKFNLLMANKINGFMDYRLENNQVNSTISFIIRKDNSAELDINARTSTNDCIWAGNGRLKNNVIEINGFQDIWDKSKDQVFKSKYNISIQMGENNSTASLYSNNNLNLCGFKIDGIYTKINR
jgi:hypothetical protein